MREVLEHAWIRCALEQAAHGGVWEKLGTSGSTWECFRLLAAHRRDRLDKIYL